MRPKIRLTLAACVLSAVSILGVKQANAQTTPENKFRFGIGLELGAPTGNASDFSHFELGATGRLQYGVTNNLALTLTSGYYNFFAAKKVYSDGTVIEPSDLGVVPLKAGIKAFFASNLYFGTEVGVGFETIHDGNTKLIVAPAIGFANKTWDVGLRYENFSGQSYSYGLVGLRVAYGFEL